MKDLAEIFSADGLLAQAVDGFRVREGQLEMAHAVAAAIAAAQPGDVVLLAGKGHERTIERRGYDEPWDEAGVAREALRSLGYPRDR